MRNLLLVLATTLVLVAAAGCSDDDGDASESAATTVAATTTAATTTAATTTTAKVGARPEPPADQGRWARQVDDACQPWQAKIDAVAPPAGPADLDRWLVATLPLVRKQIAAVESVEPPVQATNAERATLFVASLRKVERALTQYRAALRAGDPEAVRAALTAATAAGADARVYARALDVTQCGGYTA